jgi:predicted dehydrogenase
MKAIVDSGELGKLQHIDATLALPVPPGNIRYRYSLAGGATMDLGCYLINLARFLTGAEPTVDEARAGLVSPQIDRWMHISLRFPSGVTAHLDCSFFSRRLLTGSALIRGERGEMRVLNPTLPHLLYHRLTVKTTQGQRHEQASKRSTFAYQLEAFVKAVRGEDTLPTTAHDAVANMQVIDAVYRKAGLRPRGS